MFTNRCLSSDVRSRGRHETGARTGCDPQTGGCRLIF